MTICILVTEAGILQFGSISSDDVQKKQEIVSKINTFLQNPNQVSLSVKESPKFSRILSGIILSLGAFYLFYCCLYFLYSLFRKK